MVIFSAAGMCAPAEAGQRYHGGGYMTGATADGILPYPLEGVTAEVCARSCAAEVHCKIYVHSVSAAQCWRWVHVGVC
jgi:hypothetical protein